MDDYIPWAEIIAKLAHAYCTLAGCKNMQITSACVLIVPKLSTVCL